MDLHEVFFQAAMSGHPLTLRRLGELSITGRIGAADPLTTDRVEPFTQAVPHGAFPVDVLVLEVNADARVAFARVTFRDEPPARFVPATRASWPAPRLTESSSRSRLVSATGPIGRTSASTPPTPQSAS